MGNYLELPKEYSTDFSSLGRQPVNPASYDFNNKIDNIVALYYPNYEGNQYKRKFPVTIDSATPSLIQGFKGKRYVESNSEETEITIGDSQLTYGTGDDIWMSAWIYPLSTSGDIFSRPVLWWGGNGSGSDGFGLTYGTNTTPNWILYTIGGNSGTGGQGLVTLNKWQHVVAVFAQSQNTIEIWQDGERIYQNASYSDNSSVSSGAVARIGSERPGSGRFADGHIRDCVFGFGRPNAAQIRELYENPYQLLKPQTPTMYLVPSVAPVAGNLHLINGGLINTGRINNGLVR